MPDHRVLYKDMGIGAAWDRTGEKAVAFSPYASTIHPSCNPIRATLFQSDAEKSA
ncbi:DUF736 family protein [Mesorhizobium sp. M0199]